MRSSKELDKQLRATVMSLYQEPHMYAPARCIQQVLFTTHFMWARLNERGDEFISRKSDISRPHGYIELYRIYLDLYPNGSESGMYRFILERYADVSSALGIEVPVSWDHLPKD